jgi:hypothetical protein
VAHDAANALPMDWNGLLATITGNDFNAIGCERQSGNLRDDEIEIVVFPGRVILGDELFAG